MSSIARQTPAAPQDEQLLDLVVNAARQSLTGFDQVGVWTLGADGALTTVASAGELVGELDALQVSFDEGPCIDAVRSEDRVVVAPRLATGPGPWSRYVPRALDLGVRAQLSVRISSRRGQTVGGLNAYSTQADGVGPGTVSLAEVFAAQAAVALDHTREVAGLHQALESRTAIGQAVGLLMAEYTLSAEAAFAYLVRTSSRSNVKLREIARRVVEEADDRAAAAGRPTPEA